MTIEDLKMRNAKDCTALHVAVVAGQLQTARVLVLLMGGETDKCGDTALHFAVYFDKPIILNELVQYMRQKDLEVKNKDGHTALHLAVKKGNVSMVKDLAALMGEVTVPDGDTALHMAVKMEAAGVVKQLVLLMSKQELEKKNARGYTALHLAVNKGNVPILKELMAKEKEPAFDMYIQFTTHVKKGEWDNAKDFLTKLDDPCYAITIVDPRDGYGDNALHVAARQGHAHIVKEFILLLKLRHDNLELKTMEDFRVFGNSIPSEVTEEFFMKKAKSMVEQYEKLLNINLEVQNKDGSTALHLAASKGHVNVVKELAQAMRKEGLEIQDAEGFTPLLNAIERGDIDIVKELLPMMRQEGVELTAKRGFHALHLAIVLERTDIIKELVPMMSQEGLEVQEDENYTPLMYAVIKGDIDLVKELVPMMRKEGLELKTAKHGYTALHLAIMDGRMDIVKELVPMMRKEGLELKIPELGYNALHLAITNGHMDIAKEMMHFMRIEALVDQDRAGFSALAYALKVSKYEDVIEIAEYMAKNNNEVFGIKVPPSNWIPVVDVLHNRNWKLCHYLYQRTPVEYLMPEHGMNGAELLINCFRAKELDMAVDILHRASRLSIAVGPSGGNDPSSMMELACMQSAFLSGTQLGLWQRLIYNRLRVEPSKLSNLQTCINIAQQEDIPNNHIDLIRSVTTFYKKLVSSLLTLLGVSRLRGMKWIYTRSIEVLCCMSEMLKTEFPTSAPLEIKVSLFKAVEHGNVEFVTRICEACPSLAKSYHEGKNIFHLVVECRQHQIYNLIHRLDEADQRYFGSCITTCQENMLHLAGKLSPLLKLDCIHGAALQMQRELQWFKEVENIVPLERREVSNSQGKKPRELFTETHENLKQKAEESMKGTAASCTVVGTLIVTIMFAAAFTIPGGNNGNTGFPMFLAKKLFMVFIISDTLSLVSSTTSVIFFLGILTSRYAEDDFLKNLPFKMMIGLSTLFISIVTMMIAFSSALIIMLKEEYSWVIIPSILFIRLQFPLLIDIFWSTYGPGIFDKSHKTAKRWIRLGTSSTLVLFD